MVVAPCDDAKTARMPPAVPQTIVMGASRTELRAWKLRDASRGAGSARWFVPIVAVVNRSLEDGPSAAIKGGSATPRRTGRRTAGDRHARRLPSPPTRVPNPNVGSHTSVHWPASKRAAARRRPTGSCTAHAWHTCRAAPASRRRRLTPTRNAGHPTARRAVPPGSRRWCHRGRGAAWNEPLHRVRRISAHRAPSRCARHRRAGNLVVSGEPLRSMRP